MIINQQGVSSGGGGANTCTMTITTLPQEGCAFDVTCSNFSNGAPSGTYVAVVDADDGATALIFFAQDGVTSLLGSDGVANASFFMNDYSVLAPSGFVLSPWSYAYAMGNEVYGQYGGDDYYENVLPLIEGYAGTYTATVIEF